MNSSRRMIYFILTILGILLIACVSQIIVDVNKLFDNKELIKKNKGKRDD